MKCSGRRWEACKVPADQFVTVVFQSFVFIMLAAFAIYVTGVASQYWRK